MKVYLVLFAALMVSSAALGADAVPQTLQSKPAAHPWERDEALLQATIASVRKDGMKAVAPHAADLEATLAKARSVFELAAHDDSIPDDAKNSANGTKAADKPKPVVIPEPNPYPGIGFFLGSYYDRIGRPLDGLRVIEIALDLPGTGMSRHLADLLTERGAAFTALKRWDDALVSYDDALKVEGTAAGVRAYIYRGKGLVLVEMSRMAEGKAAYEEALKLTVKDPDAQRDLEMIEQLHDGGPKLPSRFTPPPAKP